MRKGIWPMTGLNTEELAAATVAQLGPSEQAAADAIVARRLWTAVAKLLPQLNIRLHAIAGGGCEAGAQRSYLRGQYDLLTAELWTALDLEVPQEFATITTSTSTEGRESMTEPEQVEETEATETDAAETAADDESAGADAAAEGE